MGALDWGALTFDPVPRAAYSARQARPTAWFSMAKDQAVKMLHPPRMAGLGHCFGQSATKT